jgi:hypothetical protein
MMKKLLVLMLVLSMASMASATLQLSVNGLRGVTDVTVTVVPSGNVTLDIWTTEAISAGVGEGYWAIGSATALSTISGGVSLWPTEPGISIADDAAGAGVALPQGENGVWGGVYITGVISGIAADAGVYDEILFHCEGPGDVIVTLYADADSTPVAVGTVTIHQQVIPEPMTMALLGLGGLFLRRRSK